MWVLILKLSKSFYNESGLIFECTEVGIQLPCREYVTMVQANLSLWAFKDRSHVRDYYSGSLKLVWDGAEKPREERLIGEFT